MSKINCYVYKGDIKEGRYLYLPAQMDQQLKESLPQELLRLMGELSFVVEFELDEQRVLPQIDSKQLMLDLTEIGYFLHLPSKDIEKEVQRLFA